MKKIAFRLAFVAALLAGAFALSGCAAKLSKKECRTMDWRMIGYEDGAAGYGGDRIGQHRRACAEHGVTPDLDLYQSGRHEGLREYCRPANGFAVGVRGGGYGGTCPDELHGEFFHAYESGFQLHTLRLRVATTAQQLEARRRELAGVEDGLIRNSLLIVSNESTPEERAEALLDTRRLAERNGRLKEEIRQLEIDQRYFEQELESYRASLAFSG
jgi:hypothetical protein